MPPAVVTNEALCGELVKAGVSPDVWFPKSPGGAVRAVEWCRLCPVVVECGAYADRVGNVSGVWGGRYYSSW